MLDETPDDTRKTHRCDLVQFTLEGEAKAVEIYGPQRQYNQMTKKGPRT